MSVDIRTRVDGEVEAVAAASCFGEVLPQAFEQHAALLREAVRVFAPGSLVLDVDGEAWTLADDGGTVRVARGRCSRCRRGPPPLGGAVE